MCNDLQKPPTADTGLAYVGATVPERDIEELILAIAGGKSAPFSGSITGDLSRVSDAMRSNTTVEAFPSLPNRKPTPGSQDDGVIAGNVHFNPSFRDDLGINPNVTVPIDSFSHIKTMKGAIDGGLEGLANLSGDQTVDQIQINDLAKKLGVESKDVKGKTFEDIGKMAQEKIDSNHKKFEAFLNQDNFTSAKELINQLGLAADEVSQLTNFFDQKINNQEVMSLVMNSSSKKLQGFFKDIQAKTQATQAVKTKKAELTTKLNTAMGKGLEGLKDLKGGATVNAIGLPEDKVTQLAKMLGSSGDEIKGQTFEDIGEMARVKINNDAATKIQTAFRGNQGRAEANKQRLQKAINGGVSLLATLKNDEGQAIVRDDSQATKLADMLGVKTDAVVGKTFKQIGEMATLKEAMEDGLEGLLELTGDITINNFDQIKDLVSILSTTTEDVQGKTFGEIGNMAKTKMSNDKYLTLFEQGDFISAKQLVPDLGVTEDEQQILNNLLNEKIALPLRQAMETQLQGLSSLKTDTTNVKLQDIGLKEDEVKNLADMLGKTPDEIKGATFQDIGEMAQAKLDDAAIKLQSLARGHQAHKSYQAQKNATQTLKGFSKVISAKKDVNKKKVELKQYLQTEMDKGLEGLKDLKGGAIVSALGLTEGQVKQLADMLGVEPKDVEDKTFEQIGQMAAKVRPEYAPLKSVGNSDGTNRVKVGWGSKVMARVGIAWDKGKDAFQDGVLHGVAQFGESIISSEWNFDQVLTHLGTLQIKSYTGNLPEHLAEHMKSVLMDNKYSLHEQCSTMDEKAFDENYVEVYSKLLPLGEGRASLIEDLFKDIKIKGDKSPDFRKLYRGDAVNATNK